jgi:alpha-glucosidase
MMRPLLIEYPDDRKAVSQNDEYLFGDDLLVAPVTKDDETSRSVYLPRGVWYDFWTDHRYEGPTTIEADAPLERAPLFARGGSIIASQQNMQYTDQAPIDPLTLDVYPDGTSTRQYYEDDGISFDYQRGVSLLQTMTARQEEHGVAVEISARHGSFTPPPRSLMIKVHAQKAQPRQVTVVAGELARQSSAKALQEAQEGWAYDQDAEVVSIKVPDQGTALKIEVAE